MLIFPLSQTNTEHDMTDILNKILTAKAQEVAAQKAAVNAEHIRTLAAEAAPVRSFIGSIRGKHRLNLPAVIAEIKRQARAKV